MKQKSSQMRFAPWPVVQAALALALSGLLLARPQAAAQGFAAGLKLCGGSLLPALFPLFVVCGLLGPLAPALGWPLRPLMRLCGIRSPRAPAVLVLDGRGRALTAAAAVKGMRDFRPDSGIRGVVLNRVSPMLYPRLKEAIEGETGVTVYGYLPNLPGCALESRHLGLVTAAEVAGLREKLSALAAQAVGSPHVRLRGLMAIPPVAAGPDGNRPFFTKMRQLYVDIRSQMDDNKTSFDCLSMGMSGDFEDAVREGATLVRVGTALFGPRPPMHKG